MNNEYNNGFNNQPNQFNQEQNNMVQQTTPVQPVQNNVVEQPQNITPPNKPKFSKPVMIILIFIFAAIGLYSTLTGKNPDKKETNNNTNQSEVKPPEETKKEKRSLKINGGTKQPYYFKLADDSQHNFVAQWTYTGTTDNDQYTDEELRRKMNYMVESVVASQIISKANLLNNIDSLYIMDNKDLEEEINDFCQDMYNDEYTISDFNLQSVKIDVE